MELSIHRYAEPGGWDTEPDSTLDSASTLLTVFASAHPDEHLQKQLEQLHLRFPLAIILGCSTAGEIYGTNLSDNSLVLAVTRFEKTRLKLAEVEIRQAEDSGQVGRDIAAQLLENDLKGVFTLTDGLLVNGSNYVEALDQSLPADVIITGGLAGDGDRFERTWLLCDGHTATGKIAAVGFYGDAIQIAHGSRGGWDLLGPEREVTHSENNVLYSLDGQPALQVYKKYLGERADGLPATGLLFPLAIRNLEEADHLTVRTILAVDEQNQSITFAGNIPEGSFVKLMRANFDRLIDGAADAADSLASHLKNLQGPALCVAISCVGRRLVLGERIEEELDAVIEELPVKAGLVGYYSYGEISPLASGRCDLHNQTMTLTLFQEK